MARKRSGILRSANVEDTPTPQGVTDDFTSNTATNYSAIAGGVWVSSGAASFTSNQADNFAYHKNSIGRDGHFV